jgi:transcriptional regulator with XRE-family HTH domain
MKAYPRANYLKAHRKKTGLSQRELGLLLGYTDEGQVSRHERSESIPPIIAALSYEAVFRISMSALFPGLSGEVARVIEEKLAAFEDELGNRSARGRGANRTAQKLTWLKERKGH